MSGFLLDTDIIPLVCRADVSANFMRWLDEQGAIDAVYLSAVTIHEMEKGIGLLEHKGATAKARSIRIWLCGLIAGYDSSVLAVDAETAWLSGNWRRLPLPRAMPPARQTP